MSTLTGQDVPTGEVDVSTGELGVSTGELDVSTGELGVSTGEVDVSRWDEFQAPGWDGFQLRSWSDRRRWSEMAIRLIDVAAALVLILLLGWLLALIALAIRISSPGPAIFSQRRVGHRGRLFTAYKFRTMYRDAEAAVQAAYAQAVVGIGTHHAVFAESEADHDGGGSLSTLVNERITRLGKFLRKTSLDELPQLWNVVRGEMSLVGPRPVVVYEVERYPDWYHGRFRVKPGLTGLWQVSGRDRLTYEEMVKLDIEFATRCSLGLYLSILARTVPAVLLRRETK